MKTKSLPVPTGAPIMNGSGRNIFSYFERKNSETLREKIRWLFPSF